MSEITYVIHIATTADRLWEALTDSATLKQNWGDIRSDWATGSPVVEVNEAGQTLWSGEVLRSEQPSVLSYTFDVPGSGEAPTVVTVKIGAPATPIAANAPVVRLELTQSGFAEHSNLRCACGEAWTEILSSLKTHVETGRPLGFIWKH